MVLLGVGGVVVLKCYKTLTVQEPIPESLLSTAKKTDQTSRQITLHHQKQDHQNFRNGNHQKDYGVQRLKCSFSTIKFPLPSSHGICKIHYFWVQIHTCPFLQRSSGSPFFLSYHMKITKSRTTRHL